MLDEHRHHMLAAVQRRLQFVHGAIARADEAGRDQRHHDRGTGQLGADAVVPALARLDLPVVEAGELAAVAQPTEMVEQPLAPGAVLVRVGDEHADRHRPCPGRSGCCSWCGARRCGTRTMAFPAGPRAGQTAPPASFGFPYASRIRTSVGYSVGTDSG